MHTTCSSKLNILLCCSHQNYVKLKVYFSCYCADVLQLSQFPSFYYYSFSSFTPTLCSSCYYSMLTAGTLELHEAESIGSNCNATLLPFTYFCWIAAMSIIQNDGAFEHLRRSQNRVLLPSNRREKKSHSCSDVVFSLTNMLLYKNKNLLDWELLAKTQGLWWLSRCVVCTTHIIILFPAINLHSCASAKVQHLDLAADKW